MKNYSAKDNRGKKTDGGTETNIEDLHCCTVHVSSIISLIFEIMHTLYTL